MLISTDPKLLLAYFLVSTMVGMGFGLGTWVVRRILGQVLRLHWAQRPSLTDVLLSVGEGEAAMLVVWMIGLIVFVFSCAFLAEHVGRVIAPVLDRFIGPKS